MAKIKWLHEFYDWEPVAHDFFSTADYLVMNRDIQLLKYEPAYASTSTFVSRNIDFFGNFQLYECDCPSKVRHNVPLRFFYSKTYMKMYELDGTNVPIYNLMEFLSTDPSAKNDTFGDDMKTWMTSNVHSYVKLFFDNVAGRHRRFEIIDSYDDLINRLTSFEFYQRSHKNADYIERESPSEDQLDYQRLVQQLVDINKITISVENEIVRTQFWNMVFRNSLFRSEVHVKIDPKSFGQLSLANEELFSYHRLLNDDDRHDKPDLETLKPVPAGDL